MGVDNHQLTMGLLPPTRRIKRHGTRTTEVRLTMDPYTTPHDARPLSVEEVLLKDEREIEYFFDLLERWWSHDPVQLEDRDETTEVSA